MLIPKKMTQIAESRSTSSPQAKGRNRKKVKYLSMICIKQRIMVKEDIETSNAVRVRSKKR